MEVDETKQPEPLPSILSSPAQVSKRDGLQSISYSEIFAAEAEADPFRGSNGVIKTNSESNLENPTRSVETQNKVVDRSLPHNRSGRSYPARINADKPIFALTVAASIVGVHPRTMRIYEQEGLVIPHHTSTKRRFYSHNDIKKFQFIQFLTRDRGVNLSGARIILQLLDELRKNLTDPIRFFFPDYHQVD